MNTGGQDLVSLVVVLIGGLAVLLLIIGFNMEMKDWRKEEQARHHDMERTGGWRESAGGLWVIGLGLGTGLGSALLLQEPLTRLAVDLFVYKTPIPSPVTWISTNPSVLQAVMLVLVVGPLCAGLVDPRTRAGCVICGALAAGTAGATLSALLGQSVFSLVPHIGILNLSLSPTPYQEIDWFHQFGLAVNNTFPCVYGAFACITGICAAVGGLLAGLVPNGDPHRRRVLWAAPLAIAATPLLVMVMLINVIMLALLAPAVQRILDQLGSTPWFSPDWILYLSYGPPLLILAAIQLIVLGNRRLEKLPTNQRWMAAVGLAGLGLVEILLLLLVFSTNYFLPIGFLALELFIAARRLASPHGTAGRVSASTDTPKDTAAPAAWGFDAQPAVYEPPAHEPVYEKAPEKLGRGKPLLPHWGVTGLAAGLLVGLIAQVAVSFALAIVMIDVNLTPMLAELKTPAIDPGKAEEVLRNAFTVTFGSGLGTLAVCLLLGLVAGLLLQWTQNNLFLPLIWVWLSRLGSPGSRFYPARKGSRWLLAGLVGLLVGIGVFQVESNPSVFALFTALLAIGLASMTSVESPPDRWPRWSIWACFAIAASGWVGLMVPMDESIRIPPIAGRAIYALLVGPALGCALFHLLAMVRPAQKVWLRLGALTTLAALALLASLPVIGPTNVRALVLTYEAAAWKKMDYSPLPVGDGIAFYFHMDRQGNFWLTSQAGLFLRRVANGWQPYLLNSDDSSEGDGNRLRVQAYPPYLTENGDGTFWVVIRSQPGLFQPGESKTPFTVPHYTEEDESFVYIPRKSAASGMVVEPAGTPGQAIWLATCGSGVLRIPASQPLDDASWEIYEKTNSGLRSNDVNAILVDQKRNVWAASSAGVDRFDGQGWQAMQGAALNGANCLFEDTLGRVWVGNDTGGARWDGKGWQSLSAEPGWPGNVEVRRFYQDQDGHVLSGTDKGALHFDSQRWEWIVQGKAINVFAEAPDGSLWMGGEELVAHYKSDGTLQRFDPADIGLPGGTVVDIHIEPGGRVWVSIAAMRSWQPAGWEIPVVTGLLFAGGLALVLLHVKREKTG